MSADASRTVVALLPDLLDVNGDAQNARVLARRAAWGGAPTSVAPVGVGDTLPDARPLTVVVGSSVDQALAALADELARHADRLSGWVADGVPLLAIGTGWELLTEGVELADGTRIAGAGVFSGVARPLPARASDDLVVDSRYGRLVGYENHARAVVDSGDEPLGAVAHGTGDGPGRDGIARDGAVAGSAIATRLHGPVLAKNPALADAILAAALGDAYDAGAERIRAVDELAAGARARILQSVGLSR